MRRRVVLRVPIGVTATLAAVAAARALDLPMEAIVEGLASFEKSYDSLIAGLRAKMKVLGREMAAR